MAPAVWMQAAGTGRLHSIAEIIAVIFSKKQHLSVPEVTDPGKGHRHAKPVGGRDNIGVPHRASWLNNSRSASLCDGLQAVGEREKGVRCGNCTLERKNRLHGSKPCGVDPAHLPCADADRLTMTLAETGIDDRVRFDVLAHPPGEEQCPRLLRRGLALGDDP